MRAWVCERLAADRSGLRWHDDWPEPAVPGDGEVTVELHAASLNYPDLLMLSGGYQFKPDVPFIPGMEGCGTITAVGEGLSGELIGERVIVGGRGGSLAERVTLPASGLRIVPDGLHDDEAAAHTVGALTAYVGLAVRGRMAADETVLVTGAGGGMGLAAVAMAKALGGKVIAVASSSEKLDAAIAAGADETLLINRATPDLAALRGRADIVFDPVGGALVMPALRALRWNGRYLVIGFVAGAPTEIPLNRLLLGGTELIGVRAGEQGRMDPAAGVRHLRAIDELASAGKINPYIGLRVPLNAADQAFHAMANGSLIGKAVVTIG
jgi:NADPH:quinone reductase